MSRGAPFTPLRRHAILSALLLLLAVSLAANVLLYRQASRPLFEEADRPLIERTIAQAGGRTRPDSAGDIRAETFPIVIRWGHRTCVELRRYDRLGHIGACYDPGGRPVEEAEGVTG